MRTYITKPNDLQRRWYVVDASGQPLGRLASRVASVLRGKHRPEFAPDADAGDFVVVINAGKVQLTGNKLERKFYQRHSGIPGGFKSEPYAHLLERQPTLPLEKAVRGMLPKNALGRRMLRKLKVYAGGTHPHVAQQPEPLPITP